MPDPMPSTGYSEVSLSPGGKGRKGAARSAGHHVAARIAGRVVVYGLLLIILGAALLPLAWMVSTSLKPTSQVFVMPPKWIPDEPLWSNYTQALTGYNPNFGVFSRNTLLLVLLVVPGTVLTSAMAAYSFSRLQWRGRDAWFAAILATMMLPGAVTLVPTFIGWAKLGAIDTFWPLALPAWFGGGAFNIFLLRQFMAVIPRELEEAAIIEGAGNYYICFRIILPLIRPALVVVSIFTFIGVWNDFFGPLIYLNSNDNYTISLGLAMFKTLYGTKWNLLMAATVATMIPVVVVLIVFQRYILKGANLTVGLKG